MSKMKELYEKVSADKALQEEFYSILKDAEKTGEDAVKERLIRFAKSLDYEVTIEEMQKFFQDLAENSSSELSAAELDMVAGGKGVFGIFLSAGSLGLGCAFFSLAMEIGHAANTTVSCKEFLDMNLAPSKQ